MSGLGSYIFEKKYKKIMPLAENAALPAQEAPVKMRRLDIGGLGFDRQLC